MRRIKCSVGDISHNHYGHTNMKTPVRKTASRAPAVENEVSGRRGIGSPKKRGAEIISAAADVFAERGYHGASTQDIADRIGVRQATLYYYIPSKEVALEQICTLGIGDMVDGAVTIADQPGSQTEKLRQTIQRHLAAVHERRSFMRVFLRERQNLPDASRKQVGKLARKYEQIVQKILEAGVASGEFRPDVDARLTTLAILGVCNSASMWHDKEFAADIGHATQGITALVVQGVMVNQSNAETGTRKVRKKPAS